ncbi:MAG: molybdenum cofactor biosynthesis protein MoaB, partial [Planctomycetales bacterium]|nr:molybdenum cofactor biosynthesis protein MoaB [Planctomycetales bacterium]
KYKGSTRMTSLSAAEHRQAAPKQLRFAVVTVSDTRTLESDSSGQLLVDELTAAAHHCLDRRLVRDEPLEICQVVGQLCSNESLDVILVTGGTGISPRDRTPEAIAPLLDAELPGFGELFRMLSFQEIGAAAMLSRALAGRIGSILIFCLPGSTAAVRLAIEKLLLPELPHLVHHARG